MTERRRLAIAGRRLMRRVLIGAGVAGVVGGLVGLYTLAIVGAFGAAVAEDEGLGVAADGSRYPSER